MRSFSDLLAVHKALDAAFYEHQCSLLHFEFARAAELLRDYEAQLIVHMLDEENLLLPLYEKRAKIEKGGDVKLFLNEHEKMRNFVTLFRDTTEKLIDEKRPESLLLKLLDRQSFYKRLCSHHDFREADVLYPALDQVTSEDERSRIFSELSAQVIDRLRSEA